MATLSHPPPALHVTAAEDDMEISSDIGRLDNDIDLDIDLTGDHDAGQDADYMLEDIRSETGRSVQDQEMNQGEDEAFVEHGGMEDAIIFDEELGDATFDEPENARPDAASIANPASAPVAGDTFTEHHEETTEPVTELDAPAQDPQTEYTEPLRHSQNLEQQPAVGGDDSLQAKAAEETLGLDSPKARELLDHGSHPHSEDASALCASNPVTNDVAAVSYDEHHENASRPEQGQDFHENVEPAESEQYPSPLEEPTTADQGSQDAQVPTETYHEPGKSAQDGSPSHPVIVIYEDNEISLFPPRDEDQSETYFLQDAGLASQPISSLLMACREVLGDTIHDEQELQIEVAELDLSIGEETAHAAVTSFSELLDVYLELHRLDGTTEPGPMYVTLTTKTRFSARLGALREAIADGRGFSQLWYRDDGEEGDYARDEHAENEQPEHRYVTEQEGDKGRAVEPGDGLDYGGEFHEVAAEAKAESSAANEGDGGEAGPEHDQQVETDKFYEEPHVQVPGHFASHHEYQDSLHHFDEDHELAADGAHAPQEAHEQPDGTSDPAEEADEEEEEHLFDYADEEEQEEDRSTGSSTIVGDGSTAQDEGKPDKAPATEHSADLTGLAESSRNSQIEAEGVAGIVDDAEEDVDEHDADYGNELPNDSDGEGGVVDDTDRSHPQDEYDPDDGAGGEDDVDATEHDPTTDTAVEHEQPTDEHDDWDNLLEPDDEQQVEWADNEPSLTARTDFAASTDTLVGVDAHAGETAVPEDASTAVDIYDEINFDEDEEGEVGGEDTHGELPAASGRPSESPPGKRSWTEHLEGDDEDGSDQGSKRLRAT